MGRNHARVYKELAEAQLIAVCDHDQETLHAVAGQFGVRGYADHREMLAVEKPQAVSVAVPTTLHERVATDCLQAGAHVLVEKPIAATLEEGRRLIDCAETSQRLLMIGHIVRFNPALRALKEKLDAGHLGRIFQIVCRRIGPYPARDMDIGVAVDLAPHDIDIMRYLTGLDPVRVYAETGQRIHTDHEDLLLGLLRFPGGIAGSLEINWLTPTKIREIWVLGEHGLFQVDDLTQDLYFYDNAQVGGTLWPSLRTLKGVSEGEMTRYALQRTEPLKAELQAFLKASQDGGPAPVSGRDGLDALRLALALVESARTNQAIEV
jgi:predicted dehydrogenase